MNADRGDHDQTGAQSNMGIQVYTICPKLEKINVMFLFFFFFHFSMVVKRYVISWSLLKRKWGGGGVEVRRG